MPPLSLLVVDDESAVQLLLRLLIEQDARLDPGGTAANGQAALDLARKHCPDAIICELWMPGMDGLQALPLLRRACPGSIIVMYSPDPDPDPDPDAAKPALHLGANAVLDKALDPQAVLDRLVELSRGRPGGPAAPTCAGGSRLGS
jgi:two-component system, chemotaxis family, protein-glutamate methylesterase/glutaminase